jgi:predicted DNA-binding WGR domain protein
MNCRIEPHSTNFLALLECFLAPFILLTRWNLPTLEFSRGCRAPRHVSDFFSACPGPRTESCLPTTNLIINRIIFQFWQISLPPQSLTTVVRYGKHGTRGNPSGQARSKTHASYEDAKAYVDQLVRIKIREGFVENQTGRVEEDGGLQAALDEAGDDEAPVRATRSGAAPAPESRKRPPVGGSGTGKRKTKKSRMDHDDSLDIRIHVEPEPSETTSLAANDHEASDVILDTIAMFESGRDFENGDGDEMPRIEESGPSLHPERDSLASTPPSMPHREPTPPRLATPPRQMERTPEPSAEPEETITPIVVAPPSPNFGTARSEEPKAETEVETTVLVEELKTAEEEAEARQEEGFDDTPALPVVREPSEDPKEYDGDDDGFLRVDSGGMPAFE